MTSIIYHPDYLKHNTGNHPESSIRLSHAVEYLEKQDVFKNHPLVEPNTAEISQIQTIHTPDYIKKVEYHCNNEIPLDPDTVVSKDSYRAALLAAGGSIRAVNETYTNNSAFALVRPPGHHAESDRAKGFCLFNNIAIAAKYAQSQGMKRVLIIDWDVHHGNGTQHSFYSDSTVMYMSTHRYPWFPGTGWMDETGSGEGEGYNINVPLFAGSTDDEYAYVFDKIFMPVALQFQPDIIMVSAGMDAQENDMLGGMKLTSEGFATLAGYIKRIADLTCKQFILVLEGGYQHEKLAESIYQVITAINSEPHLIEIQKNNVSENVLKRVDEVIGIQRQWWNI
ncbi:histone deacetylase superfamily [Methanohalobium evestigatum Z-7303]|uniref:Histone deacetylase superfamily n=1 Tax=Methanohalobium evestigatum (strain ATCC BAA-1072 / DSM 3721 / NBRC 107634 / OCM 161 / Z-7303) TaxID=644295 RepID=D7E9V5_METEZ|nr:histone deacetylase [Methanohalobium evestigatum]ADI74377.1 histone deacetylase superfamily [Methanohalobium evestigatum Z-7303]